ncbi:MAG: hypothetical protein ACO1PM_18040 [Acidovorax sp.]|jgi:hypothetical protein
MAVVAPRVLRGAAVLALVAGLAGCAVPSREPLGTPRAQVLARLGQPTSVHPLAQGERLLYSQLPAGTEVYNLDFDAAGRLVRTEQVLTQTRLESIPLDQWAVADLLRTFGPPLRVERVARWNGDIWTYRFKQGSDPRFAHVHLDPSGVVRRIGFTDDIPNTDKGRD